jgi:hypothetical protein
MPVFSDVSDILVNLKIISSIPENGRIKRTTAGIRLEKIPENILHLHYTLFRTINGDSRNTAIEDIKRIINCSIERLKEMENSLFFYSAQVSEQVFLNKLIKEEIHSIEYNISVLREELEKATIGIKNLRHTYKDDSGVVCSVDAILSDIERYLKSYS